MDWGRLTRGDGEFGPLNGLPHLYAFTPCFQLDMAEVHRLILCLKICDSEVTRRLTLCPVQEDPVLEIIMDEKWGGVVEKSSMEVSPSPGQSHLGIPGQRPGVIEGKGDFNGATEGGREVTWLGDPKGDFFTGSCRVT